MERNTRQRHMLKEVFEAAGRPLSPHEALEIAREQLPGMGIATVYRTLKAFAEAGWLITVQIPGEPPRYEVSGKAHHHHFRCRRCMRVYETKGCPGNLKLMVPNGFRLENHEVILHGLCKPCVNTERKQA